MRMKCLRILPETMPRISRSLLSRRSLNMALGNAWDTVASISIGSDFATRVSPGGLQVRNDSGPWYAREDKATRRHGDQAINTGNSRPLAPSPCRPLALSSGNTLLNPPETFDPPLRRGAVGDIGEEGFEVLPR